MVNNNSSAAAEMASVAPLIKYSTLSDIVTPSQFPD
jgi:hypothetical protein